MKKLAILTNYIKEYKKYDFYFESEKLLRDVLWEHNIDLVYVNHYSYDKENQEFTEYVRVGDDDMEMYNESYTPDILWIKTSWTLEYLTDLFRDAPFITTPSLRLKKIEESKYQMYRYLKDFQPLTCLLTSYYFYPWLQNEFEGKLVVKPVT